MDVAPVAKVCWVWKAAGAFGCVEWVAGQVVDAVVVHQVQAERAVAGDAADRHRVDRGRAGWRHLREGRANGAGRGQLEVGGSDAGDGLAEGDREADACWRWWPGRRLVRLIDWTKGLVVSMV